ncbi:MAG: hypothetical protein HY275_17390 [Gemmatimonadetes bacterium]|nr:hypothetical protein [Gemmatimonadota bacterium]
MSQSARPTYATALVNTGLVAGFADGSAAVIVHLLRGGRTPVRIFNFIASALVGPAAMAGEWQYALLGFVLHMGIAMGWTVLFFALASRWRFWREQVVAAAIAWGAIVWCVMNLVVLPLSRVKQGAFTASGVAIGAGVLMLCIGLPDVLGARRYFRAVEG